MQAFIDECRLVAECVWFGFTVSIIYHFLILLRIWPSDRLLLCVRDIILGIIIGVVWFVMMLRNNNGYIKPIYMASSFFGVALYIKVFSNSVREVWSNLGSKD